MLPISKLAGILSQSSVSSGGATGTMPVAPSSGFVTFTLTAPSTGIYPFSVGHCFKQGDLPAGQTLTGVQLTIKNTWPDGSAKIGTLSGGASLTANTPRTVGCQIGTAPSGATLTTADLIAQVTQPITFSTSTFGDATFTSGDLASPFLTWIQGPLMSSWIYRKKVGTDAHLVAWMEIRYFLSGEVEVLPWVENGYLRVAGPTNKNATYTFTLEGAQRFAAAIDLKHHQRTPLISGSALSYWIGSDPAVVPKHNSAYLMSTELVPTYMAVVPPNASVVGGQVSTFTPLQRGNFVYYGDDMSTSGYNSPIGMLPEHDMLGLVTTSNTYASCKRNGFSAGRYAIHYRDENSNRPIRFSTFTDLVVSDIRSGIKDIGASTTNTYTPTPLNAGMPIWDPAHHPSVGYVAYLLTGNYYFMEEVQFAATLHYLWNTDSVQRRNGSLGLMLPVPGAVQVRSTAWILRTLAQAVTASPDNDIVRTDLLTSLEANISALHNVYVENSNNPLGFLNAGNGYGGAVLRIAPWMNDWVVATTGYIKSLRFGHNVTIQNKLDLFFSWVAQSTIGRYGAGGVTEAWYVNGSPYTWAISPDPNADTNGGTGPWYATHKECYDSTYTNIYPGQSWISNTEGMLGSEFWPEAGEGAVPSMWNNMLPALSYAVRHGAAGAVAAWGRVTGATNWNLLTAAWSERPVWATAPASGLMPAWMAGAQVNEWVEIAGTSGAGGSPINAWGGMALKNATAELIFAAQGGHNDSSDNRVVSIRLDQAVPAWVIRKASTWDGSSINTPYYLDGTPTSRHTYGDIHYSPLIDAVVIAGSRGTWGVAISFRNVDAFNLATNTWDAAGVWPNTPDAYGGGIDTTGNLYGIWNAGKLNIATKTWSATTTYLGRHSNCYDSLRDAFFCFMYGDGQGANGPTVFALQSFTSGSQRVIIVTGSVLTTWSNEAPTYQAITYDEANDRFLVYTGATAGRVYVITPNADTSWPMTILTLGGGSTTPAGVPAGSGINRRFMYIHSLKGVALVPQASSNIYFMRVA